MNKFNQRLCGGTFFTLLLEAVKPHTEKRERYQGKRDGLSEPEVLFGLAKIIVPDLDAPLASQMPTLKSSTTEYKKCENNGGTYYPFGDRAALSTFDERVKQDHRSALAAMVQFTDIFLETEKSTKKDERLVKALLELIESDSSIPAGQAFYVREDGWTETKESLRGCTTFCLQAFLLGAWHFAVLRSEGNSIGQETFEAWCPPAGGGPRRYTADLGEHLNREIALTYAAAFEDCSSEQPKPSKEEQGREENTHIDRAEAVNQALIVNFPYTQHSLFGDVATVSRTVNTDCFNLFVIGGESFEQNHFLVPTDRVLSSYWTSEELREEYGQLSQEAIEKIKTFPALFMPEAERYYAKSGEGQQVFFGFIDSIRVQDNGVKIRWKSIKSIPMIRISEIGFALGLKNMSKAISEINHTHWAIKRINLLEELEEAGLLLFGIA